MHAHAENLLEFKTLDEAGAYLSKVTRQPSRKFSTRDFGREEFAEARSVLVDEDQAERTLQSVRADLPKGWIAFVGTTNSYD